MKKLLFVILDGVGDRGCPALGGKTPLGAARIPMLNSLAASGRLGLMHPVRGGIAPESDVAVISVLGYDPMVYYSGRGPLESHAAGIRVGSGDLAYRVNFATVGEDGQILDRRAGRDLAGGEARELAGALDREVKLDKAELEFKQTVGHRGVLVIRSMSGRLSGEVTNTDPAYGREGPFGVAKEKFENTVLECRPLPGHEDDPAAAMAARLTNEFMKRSRQILEVHPVNLARHRAGKFPANCVLTRDAGDHLPSFPPISERFGVKFGCMVEMPVERGIALLTGMGVIELPEATGRIEEDYVKRAGAVLAVMDSWDAVYIHIKGPDEPGHDGDALRKKASIEAIDEHFFGTLLPGIERERVVVSVTADHSTPCILRAHSADPVPLVVAGPGIRPDGRKSFSESEAALGSLGILEGPDLMPKLVEFLHEEM